MQSAAAEIVQQFYQQFSGDDTVMILMVADPDALASATAVKRLLWRKVSAVDLVSVSIIERTDNLTMVKRLKIPLKLFDQIDPTKYTKIVMVDSQPNHHKVLNQFAPDVIIDHHPDTGVKCGFVDIRPQYGAASTILAQYLKAAHIKPSTRLATALLFGIKTDTNNFARQTIIEDVRAFQYLFRRANHHLIYNLEHEEINAAYLKYFKRAFGSLRKRKNWIFVHLDKVTSADACVVVADFFVRVEGVSWSVVSGVVDKKLIVIFRNDGLRKNAGKVAQQSFKVYGSAGGHKSAARAEVLTKDINPSISVTDHDAVLKWVMTSIQKRMKR